MKFKHISKKQVFKNDVITVFEETLALPNDNVVTWTFTGKKEVVAIIAELENEIFFVKITILFAPLYSISNIFSHFL